MTAASVEYGTRARPERPALVTAPAEGWLSLVLVLVAVAAVGWAIDDSRWVLGRDEWTDFLPVAAAFGAVAGFAAAKSRLSRPLAHLAGAIAAALILPVIAGSVIVGEGGDPITFFRATAASTVAAWEHLALEGRSRTTEYGHYLLTLGILCWGTGQFAGFTVFRHRRPLDALVVAGLVLLANMSVTIREQLGQLILFTLAGLFLLTRAHAFDEQTAWFRRRIGDPAAVRALYLRGGTAFVVTAVVGSVLLTSAAASAPLAGMWSQVPAFLIDMSRRVERLLPLGGASRPLGVTFGDSTTITGFWSPSGNLAMTIQLPPDETERFYWRAVAYQALERDGWSSPDQFALERAAGEPLLTGTFDEPSAAGSREVAFTVIRADYVDTEIVSPATPLAANTGGVVTALGEAAHFGAVHLDGHPATYGLTALVAVRDEADPNGLTQNRLRAAGRIYPDAVAPYTEIDPTYLGPAALDLLATIKGRVQRDNPYDLARAIESYLRSGANFDYQTDVQDLPCGDLGTAECFARYKRGYCQYYATTMAALLRHEGIPARMVEGFLPGDRDENGIEEIRFSAAHAWVEVWFPGFGWYRFDPTGGGRAIDTPIPSGAPVDPPPSVSIPPASAIDDGTDLGARTRDPSVFTPADGGTNRPQSPLGYIVVAVLLAVIVGSAAFVAWQRGPRGDASPDAVWRGIGRLAGRFGFGPRPTQTVYEYAGVLGEMLPMARPELETVARAKVEVAYGRSTLSDARLRALRDAHRRLRVSLLRLAFRRDARKRRAGR